MRKQDYDETCESRRMAIGDEKSDYDEVCE